MNQNYRPNKHSCNIPFLYEFHKKHASTTELKHFLQIVRSHIYELFENNLLAMEFDFEMTQEIDLYQNLIQIHLHQKLIKMMN